MQRLEQVGQVQMLRSSTPATVIPAKFRDREFSLLQSFFGLGGLYLCSGTEVQDVRFTFA